MIYALPAATPATASWALCRAAARAVNSFNHMVRTLQGLPLLPQLPALPGRVHLLRDEPDATEDLQALSAREVAQRVGISRAGGHARIAKARRTGNWSRLLELPSACRPGRTIPPPKRAPVLALQPAQCIARQHVPQTTLQPPSHPLRTAPATQCARTTRPTVEDYIVTTTTAPPSYAEQRDALLFDLERRRAELHAEVDRNRQAIVALQRSAQQHSEWQQHGAAQLALQEAAQKQRAIDTAHLALRRLDEERERVVSGNAERLQLSGNAERMRSLGAQQDEFRAATEAFAVLNTVELAAAAKRLFSASEQMGYPTPTLALAIAQHA